jgi:hypothetical protein
MGLIVAADRTRMSAGIIPLRRMPFTDSQATWRVGRTTPPAAWQSGDWGRWLTTELTYLELAEQPLLPADARTVRGSRTLCKPPRCHGPFGGCRHGSEVTAGTPLSIVARATKLSSCALLTRCQAALLPNAARERSPESKSGDYSPGQEDQG